MKSGVGVKNPGPNLAQGFDAQKDEKKDRDEGRTAAKLGKLAGVGKTTMKKAKKIIKEADGRFERMMWNENGILCKC